MVSSLSQINDGVLKSTPDESCDGFGLHSLNVFIDGEYKTPKGNE